MLLARGAPVPRALLAEVADRLEPALAALFDRDGFASPFSAADPLRLLLVGGPAALPPFAGWEGRVDGRLVHPVAGVQTASRPPADVIADAVRTVAVLSLRQAAPGRSGWLVEGAAEWLRQRALGGSGCPAPFLAARGSLLDPEPCACFLAEVAAHLPGGLEGFRSAWEEESPDDPAGLLRALAEEAVPGGLPELLGNLVVRALTALPAPVLDPPARPLLAGDAAVARPGPMGWSRESFSCLDEVAGGLEVGFAAPAGVGSGKGLLLYRGEGGEHDSVPLDPSRPLLFPVGGVAVLSVVLADGESEGEAPVWLRRVPNYPVRMAASAAVWEDGAVHLSWRTAAHSDLLAWAVSRYEEDADGRLRLTAREVVPTTDASDQGFSYRVLDRDVAPGARLRYRVLALTRAGLLAEAFEAAVVASP